MLAGDAFEPGGARRRELVLFFVLSVSAHLALASVLLVDYDPLSAALPGVIAVELVGLPAPAAPAPPAEAAEAAKPPEPAAREAPKPLPKPPTPEKVLLPKEPRRPASKPLERAEPKPRPRPAAPPPVVEEPVEEEYEDVLAQLRAEAGESRPEPRAPRQVASVAPSEAATGARGAQVSPEVAAWMRQAKLHVRRVWVVPPGFRTQDLEAHLLVELDASGRVIGTPVVTRGSGNPWYDDGVVSAILKASPLPPPPTADRWAFVFVPEDSY